MSTCEMHVARLLMRPDAAETIITNLSLKRDAGCLSLRLELCPVITLFRVAPLDMPAWHSFHKTEHCVVEKPLHRTLFFDNILYILYI